LSFLLAVLMAYIRGADGLSPSVHWSPFLYVHFLVEMIVAFVRKDIVAIVGKGFSISAADAVGVPIDGSLSRGLSHAVIEASRS
jgi:hypothetical protein